MADTVRTEDQVIDLFPDNMLRLITAQDARDFIVSSFGFVSAVHPGPTNDASDTAGIGAFFDTNSQWTCIADHTRWFCFDGTPGAAVWGQFQIPPPPPPPPGFFNARLLAGPFLAPALKITGIQGHAPVGQVIVLNNPADATHFWPQMQLDNFSGGAFPACTLLEVDYVFGQLKTSAPGSGTLFTFDGTPVGYTWVETTPDATTAMLFPKPGGRGGDPTTAPLLNVKQSALTNGFPIDVFIRERGTFGGLLCYEMSELNDPSQSHQVGTPGQTSQTIINYAGNVSNPTTINFGAFAPITIFVGGTTINFIVGTTINPVLLPAIPKLLTSSAVSSASPGTTIFNVSVTNGVLALFTFKNVGTQLCNINVTVTDMWGSPASANTNVIAGLGPGGIASWGTFQALTVGGVWSPWSNVIVTVSFFGGSGPTTVNGQCSLVAN